MSANLQRAVDVINSSVRPVVTFGLSAGLLFGFVVDKIPADAYLTATSLVLGFWFRDRQDQAKEKAPEN